MLINRDKIWHFIVGFVVTLWIGLVLNAYHYSTATTLIVPFASGIIAGLLKELYDKIMLNHFGFGFGFDNNDFLATVYGTIIATLILIFI